MREAGELLHGAHPAASEITVKPGDDNFVTACDVAVQEFLIARFSELLPGAGFLAEEQETHCIPSGRCFIIDPIDGTTNLIHDYRHSAISVALCENGAVTFGAVLNPYSGELFYAARGEGAFLETDGAAKRICVSARPLRDALVEFGTSPYYKALADETFALVKELFLRSRDIRRSGSAALDICYVACGRCDLFFETILSPWDYAAGSVILSEAGGLLTQIDGSAVRLEAPSSVLAANPGAHAEFLALRREKK